MSATLKRDRVFHQRRNPVPCTVLNPFAPEYSALIIQRSIRILSAARGCACYLFVDPYGWAYVVSEDRNAAHRWAIERTAWWRGVYGAHVALDDLLSELA